MKILNKTMLGTAVMLCGALCGTAPVHAQTALSTDMDQVDLTLDLFFVGANSNLYETVYPFSAAREITGGSTKPKVAPLGSVVSYVNTIYGAPELFYLTADSNGNQDIEQLYGTTYSPTDLSTVASAPSAVVGSSLVGFIDSCADSDNVFYVGSNGHVELLTWTPGNPWSTKDLTQTTGTGLAVGTSIVGHIYGSPPNQTEEVFYLESDNNVHELWRWSGCTGGAGFDGWHNGDVSTANGDTGVTPATGSSLAAMFDKTAGTDALFYVGSDGHLHELFFSAAKDWSNIDITANTKGPALLPGTPLTAHINSVASSEEVFYFDSTEHVREMWASSSSPTSWVSPAKSLNKTAGTAPVAEPGSPLITDINTLDALDDVYYVGKDKHVFQLTYNGSWKYIDLTAQSGGPKVRGGGAPVGHTINFDTDPNGNAIANGTLVNDVYAGWGVTFSSSTCVSAVGVACEYDAGGAVYAVAYSDANAGSSSPKGSAPNAVSTYADAGMLAQTGVIRATFKDPQSQVTIVAFQFCDGEDAGCLGPTPSAAAAYLDAYDVDNNLLCHTVANPNTTGSWQELLVTSNCALPAGAATIAYVQFSVGWDGPDVNILAAEFDNLTF